MRHGVLAIASSLALLAAPAFAATGTTMLPPKSLATAAELREQALKDDTGWKVVESLTTEIGPRIAGGEADPRAVAWAVAKFKALGFDKVWTEPVTFPKWERRSEHAQVTGSTPSRWPSLHWAAARAVPSRPRWYALPTWSHCRPRRSAR